MTPLIGVTTSRRGGWRSFLMHRLAVWRAGGRAVRLTPGNAVDLDTLSGFIIGGGDDIGAELYGGAVLPDVRIDPERDRMELDLLTRILPTPVPVLGVCRGAQMINVALGGTLHADIHEVYETAPKMRTVLPKKRVSIVKGSRLDRILLCDPCRVNALHHQSVEKLGRGLRIVGQDEIGIVQAIEGEGSRYVVGVQWHPELLVFSASQQRLFASLVQASGGEAQRLAVSSGHVGADAS